MEFELTRSRRRTIQLQIERDGSVNVRAPLHMPMFVIKHFVSAKEQWVTKHTTKASLVNKQKLQFANGSMLPYLGGNYPIRMTENTRLKVQFNDAFMIPQLSESQAKLLITGWYKQQALHFLKNRLDYFVQVTGTGYSQFLISNAGTRWGSCTRDGKIRLNWRLMCTPGHIVDYVVVHELSHRIHFSHSRPFWKAVESVLPDYRVSKLWCKTNWHILYL